MQPNVEMINLLNATTHHLVIDYETDGETCGEVLVPLNDTVRTMLLELGMTAEWIDTNKIELSVEHEGCKFAICTTQVGFQKCGAKWWHPDHGYMTHRFE
ncbi:hypothetical protein [Paenibacillus sp. Pae108]|uniref:hypothetical protein n=1 Tax=Paenibacillus sp. Pae108 TaxID=2926019 RepID=UPI0021197FD4|nr:hypothetical protein [Paenibacillus sp. Pae108]